MNVKIDYASISNDDEPMKLRPKRADPDDEDDDEDGGDAESDSETSREDADENDDLEDDDDDDNQPNENDTSDNNSSEDDENSESGNGSDGPNEDEYEKNHASDDDNDLDDNLNDDDDDEENDDEEDEGLNGNENGNNDSDDDAEETRYRKINQDFRRNYITETHPETNTHTEDEIHALAKVVRNKLGTIIDPLHRTVPILTKYEKTRILGIRTKQLNNGAEPFISSKLNITSEKIIDGYPIALKELEEKKLPFIIRRPLPGGGVEYWYLQDLEVL